MSSKVEKGIVPKLRFPEFQDAPPWVQTTLGNEATFRKGKGIAKEDISPSGAQPCIRYGEIYTYYGTVIDKTISFTNAPASGLVLSKKDDVVIPASGETEIDIATASCLRKSGIAIGGDLNVIRSKMDGAFLAYYLSSAKRRTIAKLAQGISVVHLYADQLKTLSIDIPRLKAEQNEIADCLSSIDNLISAQTKKIETLKAYKNGLMQQLFPAEGETVPRLRFREFREVGEWKRKKASSLFANRTEEGEAGLPIYAVTMNEGMIKRTSLDREFDDIAEPEGNKKAHKHDIAYNMMRMWQGASGVAVEDCMVSPAYVVLAPRKGVHSSFFGYLFKLPKYLRALTSHSQGLTLDRLRLYYKHFAEILLPHPFIPEQKKITDCLSSLDELITVHIQKLETLKAHKKGLMQGLFPFTAEGEA